MTAAINHMNSFELSIDETAVAIWSRLARSTWASGEDRHAGRGRWSVPRSPRPR